MACSYIAWYLVRRTAESALHFTYSFEHHFNFSGKHSAMLQLVYIAMYSFIQLSELELRGVNERTCPRFETATRGFEPGSSSHYSTVLHCSHV